MSTERSAPKRSAPNFNLVSFFLPASGLHKEHKKVEDYFSTVSQKAKQKDHQAFLSSRKNWAKQHNKAGPDKKRLLSKKELVEAHKEGFADSAQNRRTLSGSQEATGYRRELD